jgi:LmbE family N-acetylglucosaminyl deacetylase
VGLRGLSRSVLTWIGESLGTPRAADRPRALVFAPHPDDEVLGCGGTIARKVREGAHVRVVFMTDGAASHRGLIEPEELVRMRRSEAHAAGAALGLTAAHLVFLDFPDHDLASFRAQAVERVAALLREDAPQEIYVPHHGDRLPDHVDTFDVVNRALASVESELEVFEYPIWLWNAWPWTQGRPRGGKGFARYLASSAADIVRLVFRCRARVSIRDTAAQKRRALQAYASQVARRHGDQNWPILGDVSNGEFLACFDRDAEVFQYSRRGGRR